MTIQNNHSANVTMFSGDTKSRLDGFLVMLRKEAVLYNVKVFATIQPRSVSYQCSNGFQAIIRVVKGQYWLKIGDRETPKDSLQVALVRLRFEFIHFVDPKRVVVPDL